MLVLTYTVIQSTGQQYFLSDQHPTLLIVTGTHGDESDVVPIVESLVDKYRNVLPPFLFIPNLSPSALLKKTRVNRDGFDLNRSFKEPPETQEAYEVMNLLRNYVFEKYITFHEDLECPAFYLYSSQKLEGTDHLEMLRKKISSIVPLLTGIDDIKDMALGHKSSEGFIHYPAEREDNSLDYWL